MCGRGRRGPSCVFAVTRPVALEAAEGVGRAVALYRRGHNIVISSELVSAVVCEGADFLVDELERLRVLAADDPEVVDGLALHLRIDELGFDAVRELLVGELGGVRQAASKCGPWATSLKFSFSAIAINLCAVFRSNGSSSLIMTSHSPTVMEGVDGGGAYISSPRPSACTT